LLRPALPEETPERTVRHEVIETERKAGAARLGEASMATKKARQSNRDARSRPRVVAKAERKKGPRASSGSTGKARSRQTAAGAKKSKGARPKGAAESRPERRPRLASRISAEAAGRLLRLEETMQRRVIGKDEAVQRIARVVRVRMAELDFRPGRPRGSFLLVGPSGVGKNELAYALAEALHGVEDSVVSIDLAEIAEEADLAKLGVTLVPGAENQAMEGLLTSPVRQNPEAVVLLRGLERAHAAFQPVLQQVLERGRLDDLAGSVDFSRTVIFVTTHPRREDSPAAEIGFTRGSGPAAELLHKRLERSIASDLLDAFNEIIEVPPLTPDDVRRIARYKVEAVLGRLRLRRRRIEVADEVYEAFLPEEEILRDGVAILHRSLENRLFNPLAVYLLSHTGAGRILVEIDKGALRIRE
jgi:ATP-dependent Clp protease ATP-binding subunit ClpA